MSVLMLLDSTVTNRIKYQPEPLLVLLKGWGDDLWIKCAHKILKMLFIVYLLKLANTLKCEYLHFCAQKVIFSFLSSHQMNPKPTYNHPADESKIKTFFVCHWIKNWFRARELTQIHVFKMNIHWKISLDLFNARKHLV